MKISTKLCYAIIGILLSSVSYGQGSDKYCVTTEAIANSEATAITLNFIPANNANSYEVYRKDFGAAAWGSAYATLGAGDSSFIDRAIEKGKMYDYQIKKVGAAGLVGYGYVTAGAKVEAIHDRGVVLLVIDSALGEGLAESLGVLRNDLVADGNQVVEYVVSQSTDHIAIKSKIDDFKKLYENLNHVYIIGHVAVPYSGIYCADTYWTVPPDGHKEGSGNHCGAWAADAYYGVLAGNWSDFYTVTSGVRAHTKNEPNDGKFDQIILPGEVKYGIGRVDLSNMAKFSKSELELTKQYINKNHNYRYAISTPVQKALVDENFGANANEQFGASGYRSFGAMVGIENVNKNDFMSTLKDEQYIVAYGTGPGSYTSAGGIGTTDNFVTNQGAAYFNMLFGSFFGNWDIANNFLRAPLAVENGGLTNAWAGRPNWHFYPMALNQTAGYCAKITQNNKTLYNPGFFTNQVHVALMGDPTLRMHMFAPPTNVVISTSDANQKVNLSWTGSTDAVEGYYVYYSKDSLGPFTLANSTPIVGTSYSNTAPHQGKLYFMVRAVRLEETKSGSFYNLSQGSFGEIDNLINTSIDPILTQVSNLSIFPNPSNGMVTMTFKSEKGNEASVIIMDAKGSILRNELLTGYGTQSHTLDLTALPAGLYMVKVNNATKRLIIK
ncbi:MAG: hypothetical protein ACI8SE_001827 [Bacteroidia bacterium]|jgi:hypothetical protein